MSLTINHIKKHWLVIIIGLTIVGVIINFDTVVYLTTRSLTPKLKLQADVLESRMFFSPASGEYKTGDLIYVTVLFDSTKTAVNAVGGEIVFPTDKLDVKSISTENSINTIWMPDAPYFSTTTNTIIFSGGLQTPGFLGITGNVLTIVFQAKMAGPIDLKLVNTSAFANDGLGTTVAVLNQDARFNVTSQSAAAFQAEDLNHDGKIDLLDISILVGNWRIPRNKEADINADGVVDVKDFSILLSRLTSLVIKK